MSLDVDVDHKRGSFHLQARFTAAPGLTALFGRSGSGKTSLVSIVGGLIRPDSGRVSVDGQTLVDTESGVFVKPHRRRIGYVFQDSRLFPHLSVRRNLLYGSWFARGNGGATADLGAVVDLLGIGHLLERNPESLSGGEKQRVAIGRALLARPRLVLMDEPLASLDESRRAEILPYIERLRDEAGVPILYVSHSVAEVARLATTVVIMTEGKVTAVGPVLDILPLADANDGGAVLDAKVSRHDEVFPAFRAAECRRRAAGAAPQRARRRAGPRLYSRPRRHAEPAAALGDQCTERAGRQDCFHLPDEQCAGRRATGLQWRRPVGPVDRQIGRSPGSGPRTDRLCRRQERVIRTQLTALE